MSLSNWLAISTSWVICNIHKFLIRCISYIVHIRNLEPNRNMLSLLGISDSCFVRQSDRWNSLTIRNIWFKPIFTNVFFNYNGFLQASIVVMYSTSMLDKTTYFSYLDYYDIVPSPVKVIKYQDVDFLKLIHNHTCIYVGHQSCLLLPKYKHRLLTNN